MKKILMNVFTLLLIISNGRIAFAADDSQRIFRKLCPSVSDIQKVVLDKIVSGPEGNHKIADVAKEQTKVNHNKYNWDIIISHLKFTNENDKEMLAKANALLHSSQLVFDDIHAIGGCCSAAIYCLYKSKSKNNKFEVTAIFGNNPQFNVDKFIKENR